MTMKMVIDPLTKSYHGYNLKGSRALELIMDNKTPKIDLLVRESIQNSADATLKHENYCNISFNRKKFLNSKFTNFIGKYNDRLIDLFPNNQNEALVISDSQTCGLLGDAYETPGKPNNLYKLVYAFLESDKGEYSGGSWGIGKSVYFRYGKGIVFYYTCTFEKGRYNHKLVGALLENEENPKRVINDVDKYLGVAFIGKSDTDDNGECRPVPITDFDFIENFLSVFGLFPYINGKTGTTIIIPYFDCKSLIFERMNEDDVPWKDDFDETLEIAIQRWYFPRINNPKIDKYIQIFINGKKVELIPFFYRLQKLYNGEVEGADNITITANNFDKGRNILGVFRFKKMKKEELDVLIIPNRYPSPYTLLDIKEDSDDTSKDRKSVV